MRKSTILHGYGSFRRVFSEGRRIEADILRGICRTTSDERSSCRIGISVRSRAWNAVHRNTIKRRIRASLDGHVPALERALEKRGVALELVITNRPVRDHDAPPYSFRLIHADVVTIVEEVVKRVCRDWPQRSSA